MRVNIYIILYNMYKYWKGAQYRGFVCGYRYIIVIIIINTFAAASAEILRAKNRPGGVSFYGRGDGCGIAGRSRLYTSYNIIIVCHNGNVNRQTADDYVEFLGIHSSTIMGPAFDTYIYIMCMSYRMNRYNIRGIVTHKVYDAYYVYIWYVYNIKYVVDNNIIMSIRRDRKHKVGVFDILISWDFREKILFVTGFSVDTDSKQKPEQRCPGLPYTYSPNIYI